MFKQGSTRKQRKQAASRDAVIKGLEATFATISARSNSNSRYTSKDKIVRDVLTTAIMMAKPDDVTINSIKAVLGDAVDWEAPKAGLSRAKEFQSSGASLAVAHTQRNGISLLRSAG